MQFEYLVKDDCTLEELQALGADGWELVTVDRDSFGDDQTYRLHVKKIERYYFKRGKS